jgi:hypothetical protein
VSKTLRATVCEDVALEVACFTPRFFFCVQGAAKATRVLARILIRNIVSITGRDIGFVHHESGHGLYGQYS